MAQTKGVNYVEQKQRFLREVPGWGGTVADLATKHGLNKITAYRWLAASKKKAPKRAAGKKRKAKVARVARNGKATNGHALAPPPVPSLETVRVELARALATVDALREAYGRVFGGPA